MPSANFPEGPVDSLRHWRWLRPAPGEQGMPALPHCGDCNPSEKGHQSSQGGCKLNPVHLKAARNMTLRTRTILLYYYATLNTKKLSSQQVLNTHCVVSRTSLMWSLHLPQNRLQGLSVYCNQCNLVWALLYCLIQQKPQKLKATTALTEMFWCQYVEVKPHRATNSSLNVTLFCHLYAFYTQSLGQEHRPLIFTHPYPQQYFSGLHFPQDAAQASLPSRSPCFPWAGREFPLCISVLYALSIIIQVTELLQYSP